jgi:tRNA pseudouridine32 synthase/23S rRNA pseudouridine746 synthase
VDKPSGLLSVPGKEHRDSVLARVLAQEKQAYAVHRLDMDTSGLMLIALRRKAERALMEEFRVRRVYKQYIALVEGHMQKESGEIDVPLSRCVGSPPRSVVDWEHGKSAKTTYKVLGYEGTYTRVLLVPMTGRSHQLRVHLLHIGYPIVGDRFYHPTWCGKRLMLHAQQLRFAHPYHKRECDFTWDVPF